MSRFTAHPTACPSLDWKAILLLGTAASDPLVGLCCSQEKEREKQRLWWVQAR
jgi:hypothetical protein